MPHRPKKNLSQNFLTDDNIARKIIDSCHLTGSETVLEIGCGQGALTGHILEKAGKLYGVEFDRDLYAEMKKKESPDFILFEADILEFDFTRIPYTDKKIKVIGNLPYHISSPIIFLLIDHRERIETATIMLQKEVAERIVSGPHTKDYGILSIFCQFFADCKIVVTVPSTAFFPKPKVDSAVLQLHFKESPPAVKDFELFRKIVKRSFNQRRKMLRNSLSPFIGTRGIDFDLRLRPEQLSVQDFIHLSDLISTQ